MLNTKNLLSTATAGHQVASIVFHKRHVAAMAAPNDGFTEFAFTKKTFIFFLTKKLTMPAFCPLGRSAIRCKKVLRVRRSTASCRVDNVRLGISGRKRRDAMRVQRQWSWQNCSRRICNWKLFPTNINCPKPFQILQIRFAQILLNNARIQLATNIWWNVEAALGWKCKNGCQNYGNKNAQKRIAFGQSLAMHFRPIPPSARGISWVVARAWPTKHSTQKRCFPSGMLFSH